MKLLSALNSTNVQVDLRVVQIRRADGPLGDLVAVDEQHRFARATTHHGRHMLPGVVLQRAARRLDGNRSTRCSGSPFPTARSPGCWACRDTNHASNYTCRRDNAPLLQLARMNPSGDGEISFADVHRLVTRHDDRVAITIERDGLAKRRRNELGVPLQLTRSARDVPARSSTCHPTAMRRSSPCSSAMRRARPSLRCDLRCECRPDRCLTV